jgi:hypothetical protein
MKQILSLMLLFGLLAAACQQSEEKEKKAQVASNIEATTPPPATSIQWLDTAKNIGKVTEGEKIEITFRFKNTGKEQLVIQSVMPSCGCTVAEKPEKPVAPGEEGFIKAAFDSKGRIGTNHKTITVYSNTNPPTQVVTFEVEVDKKS